MNSIELATPNCPAPEIVLLTLVSVSALLLVAPQMRLLGLSLKIKLPPPVNVVPSAMRKSVLFPPALSKIVPVLLIVPLRFVLVLLSNWIVPAPEKCVPSVNVQLLANSTVAPADAENVPALVPPTTKRNVPSCDDTVPELFKVTLKLSAP